jgi:integral membrane protein (TIGR01906 family)
MGGSGYHRQVTSPLFGRLAAPLIGLATAILVVGIAILPFVNPVWVGFAQERAEASAWTGFTSEELRTATDAILADLILGPPDFDVQVRGEAVLNERERGHMRDVRGVFGALVIAAVLSLGVLATAIVGGRGSPTPWRRIRRGALATTLVTVAGGALALVFFDTAFELFHRLFFPAGSYTFDPTTERLVQLFPYRFWVETATAVGAVIVLLSLGVAWASGRIAERPSGGWDRDDQDAGSSDRLPTDAGWLLAPSGEDQASPAEGAASAVAARERRA